MKTRTMAVGAGVALLLLGACSSSSSKSSPPTTAAAAVTTTTTAATTTTAGGPAPAVTVTPATGLKDGQIVQVVGKNYDPGKQYGLTECANKGAGTTANDCNLRGIKVAVADSTGTVTDAYPVAKGPFGGNNIVCTTPPGCIISVADAGSANPTKVGLATIAFAG